MDNSSPSSMALGCLLHLSPAGTMSFQLCLSVPPPAVFGPSSLPLPLGVPSQGLACDGSCWFTQGVANPSPLPSLDLALYWLLAPSLPQLLIADFLSGHLILKMRLRQLFMNVWIFCIVFFVILHVSEP